MENRVKQSNKMDINFMKCYKKRYVLKIVFSFIILIVILAIFFTHIPSNPMKVIGSEMSKIKNKFTIGTTSYFFNEHDFETYGVAECRSFAMLLRQRLQKRGYSSRIVGIVSNKGEGHNFLEVKLRDKWILTDPMSNVLYSNSLIDILLNPSLANKAIRPARMSEDLKTFTSPAFFSNALAVDFGEFYLSDNLRWTPLIGIRKYSSQSPIYTCPKSQCSWDISINQEILNDNMFTSLPMVKIISIGVDVIVSDEQNKKFTKLGADEFLPQIITPKNGRIKIISKATGPHKILIFAAVSPAVNMHSLHLRTPKPSILVFRNAKIDFYEARLICNEIEVWNKKLKQINNENFHNAFFLNPEESAWSELMELHGKTFRRSRLGLPGNEARVRLQPLLITKQNDIQCNITFDYMAKKPVEVFLYSEGNNHLVALDKLPKCTNSICARKVELNKDAISSMYSKKVK